MTKVCPVFVLGALFVVYRALNPEAVDKYSSNPNRADEDDLRQIVVAWAAQRPSPTDPGR